VAVDEKNMDIQDDLDLEAAIGAAESLAGDVNDGLDMDLDDVLNADSSDEDILSGGSRRYDFNRPNSISRTFEQNLSAVGEAFAKAGAIDFTNLFRMTTSVDFNGMRQSTYSEYLEELPNPTCAAFVTLAPLKGFSMVHIDLGLSFLFLKKLMGGNVDSEDQVREFTDIERAINAGLVDRFTDIFRKSVSKWLDVTPAFVNLENNPNYLTGLAEGTAMIIMKFMVKLDTVEGMVELGFPHAAFAPVRNIFDPDTGVEMRSNVEKKGDRRQILDMIQGTGTEITVQLGELNSSLQDVMNLALGDILHLPQSMESPLLVNIEGQASWLGEAGRIGQNRAIKLIKQLDKE
jgi:flagellar motor switch protein FliM